MFDTLKFARTLRDRGQFTPEQAEGLADAVAEALGGEVAGRVDLKATETALRHQITTLGTELRGEIAELRAELHDSIAAVRGEIADLRTDMKSLEAKIEAAKSDTIKWIVGIIGFQSVAIVGAAVVLSRYLAH
jgi:phage-related minor tail protein